MKQNCPSVFMDLCLYSEVCLLMSKYSFRLSSRRFIQELFMDLSYAELYEEPYKVLGLVRNTAQQQSNASGSGAGGAGGGPSAAGAALGQLEEINSEENLAAKG